MIASNLQPYLLDKYLQTSQPLSVTDTNYIPFTTSSAIPASYDTNRFKIIFKQTGVLPVNFVQVSASKKQAAIVVDWSVAQQDGVEKYEVERSENGNNFAKAGELKAAGNTGPVQYAFTDSKPVQGYNYYRVRAVHADGSFVYSQVAVAKMDGAAASVAVYPNPVTSQRFTITFTGMEKGIYTVRLLNMQGRQLCVSQVSHPGGAAQYPQIIPRKLSAGMYIIQVAGTGRNFMQQVLVK